MRYIEPGDGSDREAGLRLLAAEKMDLVIGVGFIFTDDLTNLAKEYPEHQLRRHRLALAYDSTGKLIPPPPNLAALKFREEEGSFLVGAHGRARRQLEEGRVRRRNGHPAHSQVRGGIHARACKYVCPDCTVIAQYAGVTPDAFKNPGSGKELALSQYQSGVNVIFHASGSTGQGVFEAARTMNKLAIGVDADQNDEAPGLRSDVDGERRRAPRRSTRSGE